MNLKQNTKKVFLIIKKIINIFLFLILLLISINFCLYYFSDYHFDIFSGISMCPEYGQLGLVLIKNLNENDSINVGEVYLYPHILKHDYYLNKKNECVISAHRLIEIDNELNYIFKGDNNKHNESITLNDINSKIVFNLKIIPC